MSIITTAEAIRIGIESIEARADIPPKTQLDAIRLLRSLEKADWHRNWTRESIIQALNEYKERTGKAPTVTNLKEHGMPKGVTIQKVFQMSPSLLLKRLFPENRKMKHVNPALSNPYGFDSEIEWLNCFREQFEKHKHEDMSCKQYNVLRDESTPTWNTIARYCKISGWTALMKKAGVAYPEKRIETAHDIRVVSASSPIVEKLEAINREKERLTREYLDAIVSRR